MFMSFYENEPALLEYNKFCNNYDGFCFFATAMCSCLVFLMDTKGGRWKGSVVRFSQAESFALASLWQRVYSLSRLWAVNTAASGEGMGNDQVNERKERLSRIGTSLFDVYARKNWTGQWGLFRLVSDWPTIVGSQVSQLTTPAFFRHDVLWIYVENSAWMQHLQFVKLDLLERVNKAMAERPVADIRWLLQPVGPPRQEQSTGPVYSIDVAEEQAFCRMTETIANQENREALYALWKIFMTRARRANEG